MRIAYTNMNLNFKKQNGLIPAIIQDANTCKVLMLGFMNKEAYQKTRRVKRVTFYSRSKKRLWTKGETSGNYLEVIDIKPDCDRKRADLPQWRVFVLWRRVRKQYYFF
ncbi:MAG: Phosphoribosyl-ATP diphosphatase [Parcubacteria group bacterium GW2011_GWF2_44_17]|nr:MAG: Phosphoribosyl-ATP diphosphatase [Parcubacteria group bacterium GW2011_GWF2_44_17]